VRKKAYTLLIKKKTEKALSKLEERVKKRFRLLYDDLLEQGPYPKDWGVER